MLDLLLSRRSIRKYKDQPVSDEIIDKIINAALTSPSGRNIKPVEFIVIKDKITLDKLSKTKGNGSKHLMDAGFAVAIIADESKTDIWIEDASIAATIIQLTAQSLDLGSCWIQMRERIGDNDEDIENLGKNILNIPKAHRLLSIIAIGYPDEDKEAYQVKDLDKSKVHFNRYK